MIILEYKIEELFNLLDRTGRSLLKRLNDEELDYEEIDLKLHLLEMSFSQLERLLSHVKTDRFQAFHRHVGFIRKDAEKFGEGNLKDILNVDLPTIKKLYYEEMKKFPFLDPILREACEELLVTCQFDSAIRKAFIVFKERAVDKFDLSSDLDGEKLINTLFSPKDGLIVISEEESKRIAFRNYCSGLYGYFRNDFAHNLVENPEYATDAVIASINMLLRVLEVYSPNKGY